MFDIPHLRAHTTKLPHAPALTSLLRTEQGSIVWIRDGKGFVAAGEAARYNHGPDRANTRFALASQWWTEVLAAAEIRDDVQGRATGLVSVGSFSFASDSPVGSTLIIPQVVVGWDGEQAWITFTGPSDRDVFDTLSSDAMALVDAALRPSLVEYPGHGTARVESSDTDAHRATVIAIQERIAAGEVEKVVLARELTVTTEDPIDERYLVERLARAYPHTWTFAVDGLVGATPELLAATANRSVHVQVLAGTLPRGHAGDAETLLSSEKDVAEHRLSVESVVEKLEEIGTTHVEETFVLELPNVLHLATDVHADLGFDATSLQVAGALHPTAALGGTPTLTALDIISEVEGIDRDRYGAPVGWMDARGGQWSVALRCARIEGNRATAWAGGGILADSDPGVEYDETVAKFAPILDALGAE